MRQSRRGGSAGTDGVPAPAGLRRWLMLLSLASAILAVAAVIFGLLVNLDTRIEMNPIGDPLVRQDAVGFRLFAWGGIALFIALLATGVAGSWIAYARRRIRLSLGLSFIAAAPMVLICLAAAWIYAASAR